MNARPLLLLLSLVVVFSTCHSQLLDIWPQPASQQNSPVQFLIESTEFSWIQKGFTNQVLESGVQRYKSITFNPLIVSASKNKEAAYDDMIDGIFIDVQTDNVTLQQGTDESYTLVVASPKVVLTAPTIFGALRGLETFSQLVQPIGSQMYILNQTTITDKPRFPYRGFMIDTARHYLDLNYILQHLDAMAYNKMNVLHWHIVDDESFPYESPTFPLLASKGAYGELPSHMYTQKDISYVIQYAYERGIRVVIEFDTPGHTTSWGKGYPFLLTECYSNGVWNGNYGPFNPIVNSTYTFMEAFWKEVAGVFPENYVHIGGDEVIFSCWESNPQMQKWMADNNYTNYAELENFYEVNLLNIMDKIGKGYIVWQEIFDNGLNIKPDTIVEVWKSANWQQELGAVTKKGFRALLSAPWYLNYISYGKDWPNYYNVEPLSFNGTASQDELVMGGEACMWAEYVDSTNLISRSWPRASAVAERLWSPQNVTDINSATTRIHTHQCRMIARGLMAEPASGPSFCVHEFEQPYFAPWLV
jgi:hexosaminidase